MIRLIGLAWGDWAYQLITNGGVECSWYSTHCYHQLHFERVVSTGGVLSTVKVIHILADY